MRTPRRPVAATIAALSVIMFSAVAGTLTAQPLPAAKELMAKSDAAMGGLGVFERHTSLHLVGSVSAPSIGMEAQIELFKAKPSQYLQKLAIGALGDLTQGYDGRTAWISQPGQSPVALDSAQTEGMKWQADFLGNFHDMARYKSVETVGLVDFEGTRSYKVKVVRSTGGEGFEFYDASTGLIAGIQASADTPMGKMEQTNIFSDYKAFADVKMPTKIRQKNAQYEAVIKFTKVEFDKVDPAVFALPEVLKPKTKP